VVAGSLSYPRRDRYMDVLRIILNVLLVITSFLVIALVLLHKGKGGGLSDMFGGGISSGAGSSGVAERNLNRLTIGLALVWTAVVILLGLIQRVGS
jgi:preprotein translocase subunit SecG